MSSTRRGLLLGGASVVLGGCGASAEPGGSAPGESETGRRADAEVLNAAQQEKLEVAARLEQVDRRLAMHQSEHLERLALEVRALGGDPVASRYTIAIKGRELTDAVTALERSIANLQDLLPKLSDRDLRSLLARMMVVDAEQLAVLRRRQRTEPAPDAMLAPGATA